MKFAAHAGISSRFISFIWIATLVAGLFAGAPAYANTYNVKSYGAVGNGTTDDTQAISNAIAAANAHPDAGNVVFFPAGTYLINDAGPSLTANGVTLSGESPSSSIIKDTNPFLQITITGNRGGINNLTIEYVQTDLSTVNPALLVQQNADKYVIENNRFTGFNEDIDIKSSTSGTIRSNSFSVTGSQTTCILIESVQSVKIESNSFTTDSTSGTYGLYSGSSDLVNLDVHGNTFSNFNYGIYSYLDGTVNLTSNTFNSCYYGLYCKYPASLNFSSNTVNNATYAAFAYNTYGATTFASNQILSNNYIGIYYEYASDGGLTISGNKIIGNGHSGQLGMYIYSTSPKITDNTVSFFAQGIQLASCSNSELHNNFISNITGGAGINADTVNSKINDNQISQIASTGILVTSSNTTSIGGNDLRNCGVTESSAFAVIYVNPASSSQPNSSSKITQNTYSGNTANLSWFINVRYGHAEVTGNKTNTNLPDYPQPGQ